MEEDLKKLKRLWLEKKDPDEKEIKSQLIDAIIWHMEGLSRSQLIDVLIYAARMDPDPNYLKEDLEDFEEPLEHNLADLDLGGEG